MCGHMEDLEVPTIQAGGPPLAARPSQLPVAEVVNLPTMVDS